MGDQEKASQVSEFAQSDSGQLADVLRAVETAFADAPRPANDELLHADCRDDGDIAALYGIPHWRNVPDEVVIGEYAALSFLSPAGFRHFLAAYLAFALRNPETDAYTVESTIFALTPIEGNARLREFMISKYGLLDSAQRAAIVAFLEAMAETQAEYLREGIDRALAYWGAAKI